MIQSEFVSLNLLLNETKVSNAYSIKVSKITPLIANYNSSFIKLTGAEERHPSDFQLEKTAPQCANLFFVDTC